MNKYELRELKIKQGSTTQKRIQVWQKTSGKCWYCGVSLVIATKDNLHLPNIFVVDHLDNFGSSELENLLPSCAYCNRSKKRRTLEEFRQYLSEPKFSDRQINYLKSFNIEIPHVKQIVFYGETL